MKDSTWNHFKDTWGTIQPNNSDQDQNDYELSVSALQVHCHE